MPRYAVTLYLFEAVILTLYISTYMLSKSKATYTRAFSTLSFSICIYLFGYLLELNSTTLDQMVFWNLVQHIGSVFFPALWLSVALSYTKHMRFLSDRVLAALYVIPGITLLLRATNDSHHLVYSTTELREVAGYPVLFLGKGPWYHVQAVYMLLAVTVSSVLFLREYRKSRDVDRSRYLFLLAASVLPHLGVVMVLLNLFGTGLDYAALILPISAFVVTYAVLTYDFLEVKSLARENIFEASPDAMLLLDSANRIVDYNQAAQSLFSFVNGPLDHRRLEHILGDTPPLFTAFMSATPQVFQLERDGKQRFYQISSSKMCNVQGSLVGVVKSIRDITEMKTLEQQLRTAATIDELSGLNNRRNFVDLAEREFERAKRYGTACSAIMLDIDHFKAINDTYGHGCGDVVIRVMGTLMLSVFRKTDILGRIGGEEFAVILPNTCVEAAELAVERLREAMIETETFCGSTVIRFTISSGVTAFSPEVGSLDEILRRADEAMYASKNSGRNRSVTLLHE